MAELKHSADTEIALLRQDFQNMSADIAEMKDDFKDFKRFFVTKEELAYHKSEWKTSQNLLDQRINKFEKTWRYIWTGVLVGVLVIVVAAVVLSALHIRPSGL